MTKNLLIAHISDSHIELPEPDDAGRLADFERVVRHIQSLDRAPDLVIHTGDITHCNEVAEYEIAKKMLAPFAARLHVIPGNKDRRENMRTVFGPAAGGGARLCDHPIQYVVKAGAMSLVMLDTLTDTSNKGAFCAERAAWLDRQLSDIDGPAAVFMHHPSYETPGLPDIFHFDEPESAQRFEAMIAKHAHVRGIFCGHAHRNTKGTVAGVPAMTLTAMSLDRRRGPYPPEWDGKPVYQLIEFDEGGNFETRFQLCDGSV